MAELKCNIVNTPITNQLDTFIETLHLYAVSCIVFDIVFCGHLYNFRPVLSGHFSGVCYLQLQGVDASLWTAEPIAPRKAIRYFTCVTCADVVYSQPIYA